MIDDRQAYPQLGIICSPLCTYSCQAAWLACGAEACGSNICRRAAFLFDDLPNSNFRRESYFGMPRRGQDSMLGAQLYRAPISPAKPDHTKYGVRVVCNLAINKLQ